jgi:hypothetical protein
VTWHAYEGEAQPCRRYGEVALRDFGRELNGAGFRVGVFVVATMRFGVLLQDRRYEVGGVDPMSPWRGATTAVSC